MALKSLVPSSVIRPKMEMKRTSKGKWQGLAKMLRSQFDFSTILLLGGLLQGILLLLIPRVWVILPTIVVLFSRFAKTLAIAFKLIPNEQMKGVIHQRHMAVIPDREGEFNKEGHGSKEQITILLLGLRINHPLGYFSPGMRRLGELQSRMLSALDGEAEINGFLGQTSWTTSTAEGSQDVLLISYWRGIEDVHRFANGPTHRDTMDWWNSNAADLKHIGISHEVFQADRGMYENVYVNFQPTRLGATTFFRKGDEMVGGTVPDQWINPLVDASRGKLRTSKGRLGWSAEDEKEHVHEKQAFY